VLLALPAACGCIAALSISPVAAAGTGGQEAAPAPPAVATPSQFAIGLRVLRLVDPSRRVRRANGRSEPRTLTTYVRYPAVGPPSGTDLPNAPAASADGPFPLVVFGHGFAVTPAIYARLLQSWARAGYVVAAPEFPLENAHAPGGPDESDLVNQPRDMSFVISGLLARSSAGSGPLADLIDSSRVAVAGQSDGGETALAVADSRRFRDPRVGAAVILSGAEMSGVGGYSFARGGPPLLAVQGTADTINEPRFTYAFFKAARRPKYLLRLLGAQHLPPYTREQPQLAIVERVTISFLDGYLKQHQVLPQRLVSLGNVPATSALVADG
jgi:fermentation-respiration switch protein FrsA (DUF1100 family)